MIFDKKTERTLSDFDWKIPMEFQNFSHWFLLPNIKLVWGREKRVHFLSFHFCLKIYRWLYPKCTCGANQNTLHRANQNIHFRATDHTAYINILLMILMGCVTMFVCKFPVSLKFQVFIIFWWSHFSM
jgi:hypothetical protein